MSRRRHSIAALIESGHPAFDQYSNNTIAMDTSVGGFLTNQGRKTMMPNYQMIQSQKKAVSVSPLSYAHHGPALPKEAVQNHQMVN